jgi:hypothetical protein
VGILDLQYWQRIGTRNQLAEVGRVTPCAPSFELRQTVVAAVGAQRTARPTFRSMQSLDAIFSARWEHEHSQSKGAPQQRAADVSSAQPSIN